MRSMSVSMMPPNTSSTCWDESSAWIHRPRAEAVSMVGTSEPSGTIWQSWPALQSTATHSSGSYAGPLRHEVTVSEPPDGSSARTWIEPDDDRFTLLTYRT